MRQGYSIREPNFNDSIVSTSAIPEVKIDEKVIDPYPTHTNYAKMLYDQKTIIDNNLMTDLNMLMAHFDRLEGKTTDYVDLLAEESGSTKPQYGMPFSFMIIKVYI